MATEEQTSYYAPYNAGISSEHFPRGGVKLTIVNRTVTKLRFLLRKVGTPTGTITFEIWADETVLASKLWGNAVDIDNSGPLWYEVTLDTPVYINGEVRIGIQSDGGAAGSNWIIIYYDDELYAGNHFTFYDSGSWTDDPNLSGTYVYTYEAGDVTLQPSVTTEAVSSINKTTATGNGTVVIVGGATQHGHVWTTVDSPARPNLTDDAARKTEKGVPVLGAFTSNLTGLSAATKYYVRAYITSLNGTYYGATVEFTTLSSTPPVLTTEACSSITSTNAVGNGTVVSIGDSAITESGHCWKLQSAGHNPTILDSHSHNGAIAAPGPFTSAITPLVVKTAYYVKAYVTTAAGDTFYGNEVACVTSGGLPIVTTEPVTDITDTVARGNLVLVNDGGSMITEYGVVYGTSSLGDPGNVPPSASGYDSYTEEGATTIMGPYWSDMTDLTTSVVYYVRAYATNSTGTSYGAEVSFTTKILGAPTVTTQPMTGVEATTATGHGTIVDIGSSAVTEHGHCWGTAVNPTTSDSKTTLGAAGVGTFPSTLTSLIKGTTYYCRAYATNTQGTSYGNNVTFKAAGSTSGGAGGLSSVAVAYRRYYVLVDWDDDDDFTGAESNIVADVEDMSIEAGKDRELGRAVASFMSLTVKNSSHKYSPPNTSSVLNTGGNSLRAGHKVVAGISFPYDSFTDSDGVGIAAHVPDAPYDPTSLWTAASGTWVIDTNKVKVTGGAGLAVMETGEADAHIAVTFVKGADNDGIIVFRYMDTSNYNYIRTDGTNLEVRKVVASVDSLVAEAALTWGNGATKTVKVILHGAFIFVLADMSLIVSTSEAANLTGTQHGIGGASVSSDARYDDWGCVYNLFYGTIDRIVPSPGIDQRTAYIECSNDFKTLAKLKLRRRAYPYTGFPEGTNEFVEEILKNNAVNTANLGYILDDGQMIQAFTKAWWDVFALEQCHQIESEENGFFYQDPDGLWRFEARGHRAAAPHDVARCSVYSVRATNGVFMTDMKWRSGMEDVVNKITVNYKRSVKQPIEYTTEDVRDLWICEEANVFGGGVTSSTLSIPGGGSKVIYFESKEYDAISMNVGNPDDPIVPTSDIVYELIEGVIVDKGFKVGESVSGAVSGHGGVVLEEGGEYILVKLDVAGDLFDVTDVVTGATSAAVMAVSDLTDYPDYMASAAPDGAGDKTDKLTVTLAAVDESDEFNYGKGGKLTLENSDAGTIYVTWLRVRGYGYKLMDAVGAYVFDGVSEGKYGEGSYDVDSELFTSYDQAKALADDVKNKEVAPRAKVDIVLQNSTKETLMQILARRLSDRVAVDWPAFGVDADFYVNSIKHHVYNGGASVDCVMSLEEVV